MPAVMNLWSGWFAGTPVKKICLQRTFDRFVTVETLGVEGMATVHKARDTQLERFVGLKLLHNDLSSEADHDV
jgi:hypothetical protein